MIVKIIDFLYKQENNLNSKSICIVEDNIFDNSD